MCVSKGVPADRLAGAVALGLATFGESRVQEAEAKVPLVSGATWHLVGHLQANKAARAVRLFSVIQSIDSLELARRLDRLAVRRRVDPESGWPGSYPVYLQVNVDADPTKAGFTTADVRAGLDELASLPGLQLRGLMTVGRLEPRPEAARLTFAALRSLSEELRARSRALGPGLSMGMSDDFEVAVEEGATLVRVGRAIFGEPPYC